MCIRDRVTSATVNAEQSTLNGQPKLVSHLGRLSMTNKTLAAACACLLFLLGAAALRLPLEAQQPATPAALTGTVRSAKEGPMEGVLVSAKRNGSTITTTVVTNAQGVYS